MHHMVSERTVGGPCSLRLKLEKVTKHKFLSSFSCTFLYSLSNTHAHTFRQMEDYEFISSR